MQSSPFTILIFVGFLSNLATAVPAPECFLQIQCANGSVGEQLVAEKPFPAEGSSGECTITPEDKVKCQRSCEKRKSKAKKCDIAHQDQPKQIPGGPP